MTIRQRGLVMAISGVALTVAAIAVVELHLPGVFSMIGAMLILVPPAMVAVGIAMAISPGDHGSGLDFGEWLEAQPTRRRVLFHVIGAVGLAAGALLLLHLGGWTVDGVIDIAL